MPLKVVTIGGGGGHAAVLQALKNLPIQLTALCNMVDDGGGSGKLMREYHVHSPGDTRLVLAALGGENAQHLNYRFAGGNLDGQTIGNVVLAGCEVSTGSFQEAVDILRSWFHIEPQVAPLTEEIPTLHAKTISGQEIEGQAELVHFVRSQNDPVETLWLDPIETSLSNKAREALISADYIIVPMGDLYSSIAPAFCIQELKELWGALKAKVIWLPNLAVTPGHVHYQTLSGALAFLQSLLPQFVPNMILVHNEALPAAIQQNVQNRGYGVSTNDLHSSESMVIVEEDLVDTQTIPVPKEGDVVDRSPLHYDTQKLQTIFQKILV
jgi:uncharacterized cofD-like protein